MSQILDENLFQRFKDGDQQAFKVIYDQYVGLIQFVAGKFNLSKSERDDVVQEAFLRLHKNLEKIDSIEKIKPWLCVTARNYIITQKRAEKKKKEFSAEVTALSKNNEERFDSPMDRRSASLVREIEINLVQDLISELGSPAEQETFNKYSVEKVSVKDIATENSESVGTVTSRLSRFRKKLKASVQKRIEKLKMESEQ